MRSPGLVVMGVAGLLVVGYAFYTLLDPSPPRSGAAGRSRGEASRGADEPAGEADEAEREARPRPAKPKAARDPNRPKAPPPARPVPSLPIDEARKQFADYIAELDALAARDAQLTSPEWVELYKEGHEKLAPLQQHLDWQVPDEAEELRKANEAMRTKLAAVDPNRPNPP